MADINTLLTCCQCGNPDQVRQILNSENVNWKDEAGNTPLLTAARPGHIDTIKQCFDADADVTAVLPDTGASALHLTMQDGFNFASAKMLVTHGVPVNLQDKDGKSVLHISTLREWHDMVSLFLQHGADVKLQDANLATPAHYACEKKNVSLLEAILSAADKSDIQILRSLKDKQGQTVAQIAVKTGMESILEILIQYDCVEFSARDNKGRSLLHVACKENFERCAMLLLQHRPSSVNLIGMIDKLGDTPLHVLARKGNVRLLEVLIGRGAKVLVRNNAELSVFGCALLQQDETGCLALLPKLLSELNLTEDGCGAENGQEHVNFFLSKEIHLAVRLGRNRVLTRLIEHISVDVKDEFESTVLHAAMIHGNVETLRILLEANVNPCAVNKYGITPYDVAVHAENADAAKLLLQKMETLDQCNCLEKKSRCGDNAIEVGDTMGVVRFSSTALMYWNQSSNDADHDDAINTSCSELQLNGCEYTPRERSIEETKISSTTQNAAHEGYDLEENILEQEIKVTNLSLRDRVANPPFRSPNVAEEECIWGRNKEIEMADAILKTQESALPAGRNTIYQEEDNKLLQEPEYKAEYGSSYTVGNAAFLIERGIDRHGVEEPNMAESDLRTEDGIDVERRFPDVGENGSKLADNEASFSRHGIQNEQDRDGSMGYLISSNDQFENEGEMTHSSTRVVANCDLKFLHLGPTTIRPVNIANLHCFSGNSKEKCRSHLFGGINQQKTGSGFPRREYTNIVTNSNTAKLVIGNRLIIRIKIAKLIYHKLSKHERRKDKWNLMKERNLRRELARTIISKVFCYW